MRVSRDVSKQAGQRILGIIWLIDGILELLPATAGSFLQLLQKSAQGEPSWLRPALVWGANVVAPHPFAWNDAVAAAELAVGVLLIWGRWPRTALAASIALAIPIWIWGQAFGGVFAGGATDIGAMPLYVLAALLVWPRAPRPVAMPEGGPQVPEPSRGAAGSPTGREAERVPAHR